MTVDSSESHAAASLSGCYHGSDSPQHVTNGHPDPVWRGRAQRYSLKDLIVHDHRLDLGVLVSSALNMSQHCALVVTKITAYWAASAGA